jgi:hypothetical protein
MSHATYDAAPISRAVCASRCSVRATMVTGYALARERCRAAASQSFACGAHERAASCDAEVHDFFLSISLGREPSPAARARRCLPPARGERRPRRTSRGPCPWSSMRPNHTGPTVAPEVESRVHEAVHAARRALGRRVADDEIARGPCRAHHEADHREHRDDHRARYSGQSHHREQRRAGEQAPSLRRCRAARCARQESRPR